jgi:ABC-type sulfate transport system substrate-binding protein
MRRVKGEGAGSGKWRAWAGGFLAVLLVAVAAVYAVRSVKLQESGPTHLIVYGFSTQEEVFAQGIFPAFERKWEAETGRDLELEGVFGASGTLAGQINLGAPADIAVLSNVEHVNWLKVGGRVHKHTEPVIIGCTPMVIGVRPGNPLHVAEYADLAKPGLALLQADPLRSGAGEWAVLAEYGSAYLPSGDQAAGEAQLTSIWQNVRLMPSSSRAAMGLFELGAGDALVTYEQDTLLAKKKGAQVDQVIPQWTIVAQHAAVIVDDNVTRAERPAAEAFLSFVLSSEGQQILADYELRPANCQSDRFPALVEPFSVDELGGWSKAYAALVEEVWQTQIEPSLNLNSAP